jgi:hypothetical protein
LLQFLQPIWFSALAGVAVPVIIHLWNQRPGKTLKVGSILLVTESLRRHQNKIQLSEILLLLLRCFLIASIAIALTAPGWRNAAGKNARGWVLMNGRNLPATYKYFKPTIDSLLSAGFEFHFFDKGFKKEKLQHALQDSSINNLPTPSYRNLVDELNQQIDTALPLYIFTDQYLRNFNGDRSAVALNLHWQMSTADSLAAPAVADTTALQITIFTHRYNTDARYLQAALEALRQFSKKNIRVQSVSSISNISSKQDWLFFLEDSLSATGFDAKNILLYAAGHPATQSSVILPADGPFFAPIALNKLIREKDSAAQSYDVSWQDGFGHPVLTALHERNTVYYKLYTHINPSWNELPWSGNFPAIVYNLLYRANGMQEPTDNTLIDPVQAMPLIASPKESIAKPVLYTVTPLAGICWLLALVLFFAERALSFYCAKTKANG